MTELKFVLDSNVLVSAALFKGSIGRQAFKSTVDGQILISEAVLAELQDVFSRPRFDRYKSEPQVAGQAVLAISDTSEINLQANAGRLKSEDIGWAITKNSASASIRHWY